MAACKYVTEPRSPRRNLGFSYLNVPCSPSHSVHSQPTVPRHLTYDGHFNSLPRHVQLGGESTSQPQARNRKRVNTALQDYLKSLNSMTRSIVLETETVEKEHQCEWKKMDHAKREEVVNDHFIPADIRFHYDFDYDERAPSCCSFTSSASWGGRHYTPSLNSFSMDNGPLSQPSDLEQWPSVNVQCGAPLQRGRGGDGVRSNLSRSNNDLLQRNQWQYEREELSLSQPSLYYYGQQETQPSPHHTTPAPVDFVAQPTFNRLHKKQLSFRPSHKQHAVRPPPQIRKILPRDGLGSDGESQRTSDEDYEQRSTNNLLGFQRSKLRSYSMRSRRSVRGGSSNGGNVLRASVRSSNRVRPKTPEPNRKIYHHNQQAQSNETCRPSHYHNYSTDTDFDEEIDLPDNELMMDHIQSPTHNKGKEFEGLTSSSSPKPQRFSKSRRSLRSSTRRSHEAQASNDCEITQTKLDSTSDEKEDTDSLDGTIDSVSLLRVSSHDSLDTISISPSISSKNPLQSDDDIDAMSVGEQSRMQTPDSLLSSDSFSYRPKSKTAEMAVMRNCRGKRGGSSYVMVTSEFADRHTQFKSNMLKKQLSDGSSASTTRASSPAGSIRSTSTPIPPSRQSSNGEVSRFLKPPSFSLPISKQNSLAESITSDLARSPDHLCSPPSTPLAIVYTAGNNLTAAEMQEKRESGYLSSSCESFQVAVPFRR